MADSFGLELSTVNDWAVAAPPSSIALTTTGTRALAEAGDLAARGLDLVALLNADLPPAAIAVTRTRPPAWEYLVFAHVLCAEVDAVKPLRESAFSLSVATVGEAMPETTLAGWVDVRTHEVVVAFSILSEFPDSLREAMKAPGTPADLVQVAAIARSVAEFYRGLLEWKRRVRKANFPPRCKPVQEAVAASCDGPIEQIEEYGRNMIAQIASLTARLEAGEQLPPVTSIHLNVNLKDGAVERVQRAWTQLAER